MANDISLVADILIAEAAAVLREMATTARRVTTEWADEAAQPNQKISIPIASPKTVTTISTPRTPFASAQDVTPRVVDVTLDRWRGVNFFLTDREQMEMKPGIFPKEAEEALRAMVNVVDIDILNTAKETPYYAFANGLAGGPPPVPTPGQAVTWAAVTELHRILFENKCPMTTGDLSCFIDGVTQAELLQLPEFVRYDATGETGALRTASLGTRLGIDFFANQNVPNFTVGPTVTTFTVNGAASEGWNGTTAVLPTKRTTQRINIAAAATGGPPVNGDIINIVGSGDHAVVGGVTAYDAGPNMTDKAMTVRPCLRGNVLDAAVMTYSKVPAGGEPDEGNVYKMNYAFHRSAIAFASRPLSTLEAPGSIIRSVADPLSGISCRLEVVRVGKTNEWQWDILYGVRLVREELAARWIRQTTA